MMGAARKRRHSVPATAIRRPSTRKVVADFPAPLFDATDRAARELSINRSHLIRSAVEEFLQRRNRAKLEREIADSFAANAELDRRLVEDFRHVDAEAPEF